MIVITQEHCAFYVITKYGNINSDFDTNFKKNLICQFGELSFIRQIKIRHYLLRNHLALNRHKHTARSSAYNRLTFQFFYKHAHTRA